MKSIYIILLYFCTATFGYANTINYDIKGHILDKKGEHLPYISVGIKGTAIGTTSDEHGHFTLPKLKEGKYIVVASSIGYKTTERPLNVGKGQTTEITLILQEESLYLEEVVVSANRFETSRKEAPVIVSLLSPKTMEITNSNNLAEGLCYMPGLRVENNCQNCGYQQVRINGLEGQYSQLLIDSRPIVSALTGVYGIEQIPSGMIDRVEVIRGGGSALYGANAIAGIINIITKEPVKNSGMLSHNLTMIGGDAAENSTNLNASLVNDDYSAGVFLFGTVNHRNPYDADEDGYTELPKLAGTTVGFRGYYKPTKMSKLMLEYHNINEYRRGGNRLDLPPHEADIAEQLEHDINGGGVKYDLFSSDYKQKLSIYAATQYTDRKSYYGAGKDPNAYGTTTDLTADGGVQYSYDFNKLGFMPATLIGGVEYNFDQLKDEQTGYNQHTDQIVRMGSLFLQNEWKNERFSILLGARLDKHNMMNDPVFSPRINLRYNPKRDIGFRVSYAEGFRAPQTFSEDLHISAAGGKVILLEIDPDLKPERSRSYSGSADLYHMFGSVQTNLLIEGFYTDLQDVFTEVYKRTDAAGNIIHEKTNTSGAVVKGINLEGKVTFNANYQLQAGFTFQRSQYKELPDAWSEEVEPTKKMLRTPDVYGYFTGILTPFEDFSISLSGTYTGDMLVQHYAGYIAQDQLKTTPDFFDANAKLSYTFELKGDLEMMLYTGMENLFNSYQSDFDKGPERDAGYIYGPVYPRSYFAGIKFTL